MKNSASHSLQCLAHSPVGLTSTSLPFETIEKRQTEDDLLAALSTPPETPEQQAPFEPGVPQSNNLNTHPVDQNGEESVPQNAGD